MKLQKIILCVAIALTAFGASLGLLEIGAYIRAALQPIKVKFEPLEPVRQSVFVPARAEDLSPPAPPAENAPIEEAEPEDWGYTGDYYIVGEKPKGFGDFLNLSIEDHVWSEKYNKPVAVQVKGSIETSLGETNETRLYNFSSIKIKGNKVSLVTESKRGISYQFDGRFVEQEVELEYDTGEKYTETIYLKGRLSKWRDGKKIAEAKVRMSISHGC